MATLYVIGTPIGNLEDISLRALRILKEVGLILCEDTRTTKKLLNHYQISKPLVSYHQHSKLAKLKYILKQLEQNRDLALVSDAGTPSISDPGAKLISYLKGQLPDLEISPIPGPSAVITALSISGLPADRFVFLGFPPIKKKRKKFFQKVVQAKHTVVFYESPHRILRTLNELSVILSASEESRHIVLCRELTKKFETIYRGHIRDIIQKISPPKGGKIKGEFVIVVGNK